jgi:hypothetical protein
MILRSPTPRDEATTVRVLMCHICNQMLPINFVEVMTYGDNALQLMEVVAQLHTRSFSVMYTENPNITTKTNKAT